MPKDDKKDDVKDDDKKVDDKSDAKPGETGEDGKYTDEGLEALVKDIIKKDAKEDDKKDDKKADDKKDDKKDDKEQMVPISRLNTVIDERNKLRQQVTAPADDKLPTVQELRDELNIKRGEWQAAIFDNDKDKAQSLLAEMNTLEVTIDDTRQAESESSTRAMSADDIKYDTLLATLQKDYPALDKTSDDFDQEVVTEVFNMREAYIVAGYSQTDALNTAAKYILKPDTKKVKETTTKRKDDSKKSLTDALSRQPADVSDVGAAADAINNNKFGIDINRLTTEQFDKLDDKIKQQLRGDVVEEHHLGVR